MMVVYKRKAFHVYIETKAYTLTHTQQQIPHLSKSTPHPGLGSHRKAITASLHSTPLLPALLYTFAKQYTRGFGKGRNLP